MTPRTHQLRNHVTTEFVTGKLYTHGRDRLGRPVMYQKPRFQNVRCCCDVMHVSLLQTKDHVVQVQQVVYVLEREMTAMNLAAYAPCIHPTTHVRSGIEQHVMLIDFKDYSLRNSPPMHVTKARACSACHVRMLWQEVMNILLDQFPERMGLAFCVCNARISAHSRPQVDAPWLFHTAFKIIRPFIPSVGSCAPSIH